MKDVYVFDLDGTIADNTHRLHFLKLKTTDRWDIYKSHSSNDTPILEMLYVFNFLCTYKNVIVISGRNESERLDTLAWLKKNTYFSLTERLFLRPDNNFVSSYEYKAEQLHNAIKKLNIKNINLIFDNDLDTIMKFKHLGYMCMHVVK
jgi:hypothetical protein